MCELLHAVAHLFFSSNGMYAVIIIIITIALTDFFYYHNSKQVIILHSSVRNKSMISIRKVKYSLKVLAVSFVRSVFVRSALLVLREVLL